MQSLAFQSSNILENLYTDGIMTYITTPTVANSPHQFNSISTYCNTYIPTWKPSYNDPRNRLAYNPDFMCELVFYKNLILAIPLYISNQSKFDSAIALIKSYCYKLTRTEDGLDISLAKLLDYKFIFYSPNIIAGVGAGNCNIFKTKKTIINTELYTEMYQSKPVSLSDISIGIMNTYQNVIGNCNVNNPLYIPYQTYTLPSINSNNPYGTSSMIIN